MNGSRTALAALSLAGLILSISLGSETPAQPDVAFTFTFDSYDLYPTALAVDAGGNSYLAGTFSYFGFNGNALPIGDDAAQKDPASMWVAKIESTGRRIVWATYLGGHHNRNWYWRGPLDSPSGISVDAEGNVYVGGRTAATDFPTVNALIGSPQARTGTDGFLVKLNPSGSKILFSTYLGGPDDSTGARGVATDWAGNAYVGLQTNRPLGFETRDLSEPGASGSAVLVKLNPAGGLVYATRFGRKDDGIQDIVIDPFGALHAAGYSTWSGGAFAAALDASGSRLRFYSPIRGVAAYSLSVATDPAGATYVTGITTSSSFEVKNAYQSTYGGQGDFFLTKLDRTGSVIFSTYLGGTAMEGISAQVLVDAAARPTVIGMTRSRRFDGSSDIQHPDAPIFKSRDAGRTWTRTADGLDVSVSALAVTATGPRIWYAGAEQGIWRSVDEGASWERAGDLRASVAELAIDERHPDTVYAGTVSGLYKTDDRGDHWTLVDSSTFTPGWWGTALGIDGNGWVFSGARGFRRSKDGGRTWQDLDKGLRVGPTGVTSQVGAMAFGPAAGIIYVVQTDTLYRTTDGGETWTRMPDPLLSGSAHALALTPGRPHRIFFSKYGLVRSDDDGATWKPLPMQVTTTTRVLVRPGRDDSLYVVNGLGGQIYAPAPLYVSTDAGESWARATSDLPDQITTMAFDARDSNVALAAAPIRALTLVLGLDETAKRARLSGFLQSGEFLRAAQDPNGALYIAKFQDKPALVKLRPPAI